MLFPFYGDVALMKLAVRSVLAQEHGDFRLLVVDDGYPDDSIPGWFAALDDPRVYYERNETNLGANGNYRKCLGLVEHELCVVMGADDVMMPNYLQWLVGRAAEHPDADIFQPGVFVIDEFGAPSWTLVEKVKAQARPRGRGVRLLTGEALAASLLRSNWLYFPSIGWRSETVTGIGFREGYDVVQDLALALDVAANGGTLLVDDVAAFMYRRHSASDSSARALQGSRFDEERRYFELMSKEMAAKGWFKAARVAASHTSSRLHALSLVPKAVKAKQWTGVRNLSAHVVK